MPETNTKMPTISPLSTPLVYILFTENSITAIQRKNIIFLTFVVVVLTESPSFKFQHRLTENLGTVHFRLNWY